MKYYEIEYIATMKPITKQIVLGESINNVNGNRISENPSILADIFLKDYGFGNASDIIDNRPKNIITLLAIDENRVKE